MFFIGNTVGAQQALGHLITGVVEEQLGPEWLDDNGQGHLKANFGRGRIEQYAGEGACQIIKDVIAENIEPLGLKAWLRPPEEPTKEELKIIEGGLKWAWDRGEKLNSVYGWSRDTHKYENAAEFFPLSSDDIGRMMEAVRGVGEKPAELAAVEELIKAEMRATYKHETDNYFDLLETITKKYKKFDIAALESQYRADRLDAVQAVMDNILAEKPDLSQSQEMPLAL